MHESPDNTDRPAPGDAPNARPDCLSNQAKPPAHQPSSPPLCCPACGYNLTGSCTIETPVGNCPECGLAFEREALLEQWSKRQSIYSGGYLIKLFGMPALLAPLPLCCGLMSPITMGVSNRSDQMVIMLMIIGVPVLGVLFASWLLAYQYHHATTMGVPVEDRRGMQRHIILPWALFFFVELILTAVYFAVGCALVLGILTSVGA